MLPHEGQRVGDFVIERRAFSGPHGAVLIANTMSGPMAGKRVCLHAIAGRVDAMACSEIAKRFAGIRAAAVRCVRGCVVHEEHTLIVTDEYEGISLALENPFARKLPPERTIQRVVEVCGILQRLHDVGVVHGALSPGSILTAPDNRMLLVGIGMAGFEESQTAQVPMARDCRPPGASPRVPGALDDQYALAATLWWCLTGQRVTASLDPQVPGLPEIAGILRRALASDPSRRFPDVLGFGSALSRMPTALMAVDMLSDTTATLPLDPFADEASNALAEPTSKAIPVAVDGSASWIVGGEPVDAPVIPKDMLVAAAPEEVVRDVPVWEGRKSKGTSPVVFLLAGVACLAVGGVAWWSLRAPSEHADTDVDAGTVAQADGAQATAQAKPDAGSAADLPATAPTGPQLDLHEVQALALSADASPRSRFAFAKTHAERAVEGAGLLWDDDDEIARSHRQMLRLSGRQQYAEATLLAEEIAMRAKAVDFERRFILKKAKRAKALFSRSKREVRNDVAADMRRAGELTRAEKYTEANARLTSVLLRMGVSR